MLLSYTMYPSFSFRIIFLLLPGCCLDYWSIFIIFHEPFFFYFVGCCCCCYSALNWKLGERKKKFNLSTIFFLLFLFGACCFSNHRQVINNARKLDVKKRNRVKCHHKTKSFPILSGAGLRIFFLSSAVVALDSLTIGLSATTRLTPSMRIGLLRALFLFLSMWSVCLIEIIKQNTNQCYLHNWLKRSLSWFKGFFLFVFLHNFYLFVSWLVFCKKY